MCDNANNGSKEPNGKIDELLFELGECREDARDAENKIFQILGIAAALIAIVYGYGLSSENDNTIKF